jgi:lipopolysaccharide heptosyltransferase II
VDSPKERSQPPALDQARILLIKPSSLGDIVHALPVVSALKERWPTAHVTWLVKRQWADLLERAEGVDRVWSVDATATGWLGQVRALRSERFHLAVDLQGLFRSGALAGLCGAPRRIGFANGREGSPWFYTEVVRVPCPEMHAVDRYLLVAEALGAHPKSPPQFRFKITESDMVVIRSLFQSHDVSVDGPWVAMHVSARWPTKRWPLRSFGAVVDLLDRAGLGPVVLIGSSDDRRDVDQLRAFVKGSFVDLSGILPVGCLPALLSRARVLVTNDSGPMHVAAAIGTPVVAMFGPTSALRTGPYGPGHHILAGQVPCSPCFSRVCRHAPELECLHLIKPNEVVEAVQRLLTTHTVRR